MEEDSFSKQPTLPDLVSQEIGKIEIPAFIGPYRIKSLFSKGGMSVLFLGTHKDSTKPLLIKVLLPKFAKNEKIVDRFLKEAHIIAMTNHPNIIQLHGQGKWEGGVYIAMDFIQGISLRQFIERSSVTLPRALEIVLQVAYALCHLHTHGVIHRDLKPENILITESGDIKVIDFGIAQLLEEVSEEERGKGKKQIIGTPSYMSPEQKKNPRSASFASDIYSLGVITYELIIGKLSHGIIHLSLIPVALRKILKKALMPDPKERYADIVDFITDISEYLKKIKDAPVSETSSDMIETWQNIQSLLLEKNFPTYHHLRVGIASKKGSFFASLYQDLFKLDEAKYLFILVEPKITTKESIAHTCNMRGMIRALVKDLNKHLPFSLSSFLGKLDDLVLLDPFGQNFSLVAIYLDMEKNSLSFSSCGEMPAIYLSSEKPGFYYLKTPNLPIGSIKSEPIIATKTNWNVHDRLYILSSSLAKTMLDPKKKTLLEKTIEEMQVFSTQKQAEKIFTKWEDMDLLSPRLQLLTCLERS